ncbi:MAG: LON peptidase substrate-binding domain-containing protein [Acidobacteriota bacterium]
MSGPILLPLFPLPRIVHFPRTTLPLHVFEQRYRQLVADLLEVDEDQRLIGMVTSEAGSTVIHPTGTAGLLVDVEPLEDGRSNIVLEGAFRFQVVREDTPAPYRRAWVERLDDDEPALEDCRPLADLHELVPSLARDMPETFPLDVEDCRELSQGSSEELVNRLAAELDLTTSHKIRLLSSGIPERAASLLRVLEGFRRNLDLLAPYRHLATTGREN